MSRVLSNFMRITLFDFEMHSFNLFNKNWTRVTSYCRFKVKFYDKQFKEGVEDFL